MGEWAREIEWDRKLTQASRPANSTAREDLRIARSRKEGLRERVLEGSYMSLRRVAHRRGRCRGPGFGHVGWQGCWEPEKCPWQWRRRESEQIGRAG